jgi:hypothetical protein
VGREIADGNLPVLRVDLSEPEVVDAVVESSESPSGIPAIKAGQAEPSLLDLSTIAAWLPSNNPGRSSLASPPPNPFGEYSD